MDQWCKNCGVKFDPRPAFGVTACREHGLALRNGPLDPHERARIKYTPNSDDVQRLPPDFFAGPQGARLPAAPARVVRAPEGQTLWCSACGAKVFERGVRLPVSADPTFCRRHTGDSGTPPDPNRLLFGPNGALRPDLR